MSSLLIDRNYLAAKWYGFVDSQSGIDIYVIRVGKAQGSGDIMSSTVVTETDAIFMTYLSDLLPLNRRIYITVRAYNKAGRWTVVNSLSSNYSLLRLFIQKSVVRLSYVITDWQTIMDVKIKTIHKTTLDDLSLQPWPRYGTVDKSSVPAT